MRYLLLTLIVIPLLGSSAQAGVLRGLPEGPLPIWVLCDREEVSADGATVYYCQSFPAAGESTLAGWCKVTVPRGGIIALQIENEGKQTKLIFQGMLQSATVFKIYTGELVFEDAAGRRSFAGAISKGKTYSLGPANTRQAAKSPLPVLYRLIPKPLNGENTLSKKPWGASTSSVSGNS